MHVLVISPTPTSPADQGNRQRVKNVCQALKERGATIHFAYFPREWGGKFSKLEHTEMTSDWDFFDTIVPSKPFVYQTANRYFGIDDWWDDAIGRFVHYKCGGMAFDACIVNYAFFSKAFEHLPPNVIRILDTHDRLSGRREMLESHGVVPEFFYTTEDQEKIALDRADVVLAINPEEATVFRGMTNKPVITLGHIAPRQELATPEPRSGAPFRMGFLGSSNSVNVKNMNDFLRALAAQVPDGLLGLQFDIYGGCCPRLDVPSELGGHVKLRGRIEEIPEFYANVDCVFVPFLFGTGQKIKLIEALSFGKPLIATRSASEGSGSTSDMHLLETFDEVIQAMRRFAAEPSFRARLAKDTASEFAKYEATVGKSVDTVFEIASLNSMEANIDRTAVARSFAGLSKADIVNGVARVVSVLDLLDAAGPLKDKGRAIQTLLAGVTDALTGHSEGQTEAGEPYVAQVGATQVVLSGLSRLGAEPSSGIQLKVHLPSDGATMPPSTGPAADLFVDCSPDAPASAESLHSRTHVIHTPSYAQEKRQFDRFEQVLVFCESVNDPRLVEQLATLAAEIRLRTERKMTIGCVDREGRRGTINRDSLDLEDSDRDPVETLMRCRALALGRPSIAMAMGFTHATAGPLHRILINDCGPLISSVSGHAMPVDGEIFVRSVREAALWASHFVMAPRFGNTVATLTRRSASATDSMDTIARRLHAAITAVKREHIVTQVSALASQEVVRTPEIDVDLSALMQAPAEAAK